MIKRKTRIRGNEHLYDKKRSEPRWIVLITAIFSTDYRLLVYFFSGAFLF